MIVALLFLEELLDRLSRNVSFKMTGTDDSEGQQMVSAGSLVEILDGVVLLYNLAAHKQLGKVCIYNMIILKSTILNSAYSL